MKTLIVSVDRTQLEKYNTLGQKLSALQAQEKQLRDIMSGEAVDVSEETRKKFRGYEVIGQARRGGLQSNLQAHLAFFKDEKNLEDQREIAWDNAQKIRSQIERITYELDKVGSLMAKTKDEYEGAKREFLESTLKLALMALQVAPA